MQGQKYFPAVNQGGEATTTLETTPYKPEDLGDKGVGFSYGASGIRVPTVFTSPPIYRGTPVRFSR